MSIFLRKFHVIVTWLAVSSILLTLLVVFLEQLDSYPFQLNLFPESWSRWIGNAIWLFGSPALCLSGISLMLSFFRTAERD